MTTRAPLPASSQWVIQRMPSGVCRASVFRNQMMASAEGASFSDAILAASQIIDAGGGDPLPAGGRMMQPKPPQRSGKKKDIGLALLWLLIAVNLAASIGWGVWPIVRDCGRLPLGPGETLNRMLGLLEGCHGS